ncbi:hypothetical protein M0Q97_08190 [Candidatus Dojkabacteria bacterium]|jgi:hypothetical protein|nr:hypothetical protein [Candidatus Dojkabacteria bacterium]
MKKNIFIKLNEFLTDDQSIKDDELLEMSNLWGKYTGLGDVVIWVGSTIKSQHGKRIKISNINSKTGSSLDCFTITIPDLNIIGRVNKKHITKAKLEKIFKFIELNMEIISDICEEKIDSVEFITRMKKVDEL